MGGKAKTVAPPRATAFDIRDKRPQQTADKPKKPDFKKQDTAEFKKRDRKESHSRAVPEEMPPMVRYRVEVGSDHGAKTGNIVGAIANEAGIENRYIGKVKVFENYTLIDLPEGMPKAIQKDLRKVWVCSRQLQISRVDKDTNEPATDKKKPQKRKSNVSSIAGKRKKNAKPGRKKHRGERAAATAVAAR
ncbi:MAG: DbpA RNA binding domain-containing protein [Pseudomonadota bacterium]